MAHIHNEEAGEHDGTVSAFIILLEEKEEPKILLHRHRKLGFWFQPGGHVELDENPWQAIAHELKEETGYELSELSVLQSDKPLVTLQEVAHPIPILYRSHRYIDAEPAHYHTDATYGFLATAKPKELPAAGESQTLGWFTRDELRELDDSTIHPDIRAISCALLGKFQSFERVPASDFSLATPELQDF